MTNLRLVQQLDWYADSAGHDVLRQFSESVAISKTRQTVMQLSRGCLKIRCGRRWSSMNFEAFRLILRLQASNLSAINPFNVIKVTCIVNEGSMDMNAFNLSATLNVFRIIVHPALCLPHTTISTFNQLPVPLNKAFQKYRNVDIRAVVLDKDNCFAYPHSNEVFEPYKVCTISTSRISETSNPLLA